MKKHEIAFLLGIAVGFALARPVNVFNINGNSNTTIRIGTRHIAPEHLEIGKTEK